MKAVKKTKPLPSWSRRSRERSIRGEAGAPWQRLNPGSDRASAEPSPSGERMRNVCPTRDTIHKVEGQARDLKKIFITYVTNNKSVYRTALVSRLSIKNSYKSITKK